MSNNLSDTVDLTDCDREPIHIPGAVQPHGVLIVVGEPDLVIKQISENCERHFGFAAGDLLGRSLNELLAADELHRLKQDILSGNLEALPTYLPAVKIGKNEAFFEGIAHRFNGQLIFEFEFQTDEARDYSLGTLSYLRDRLSHLDQTKSLKDFCQAAAQAVRGFCGFDRVMVYRFLEDGAGHVFAEDKRDDLESFLELHYPASDIPQQARRLFLLNPIRVVLDTSGERSPIIALSSSTEEPLDMSYTMIRSTSPIHLEYLRNMGVAASMSISIVRDDQLWGLFACHHYSPRYVSHAARIATEFLSHYLSLQIGSKERSGNYEYLNRLKNAREKLVEKIAGGSVSVAGLLEDRESLFAGIEADGAALLVNNELKTVGATPTEEQINKLTEWLWNTQKENIFHSNALSTIYPASASYRDSASGLTAIRLTQDKPEYLLWFRSEYLQAVKWAGDPSKPLIVEKNGARLTPRKSFELWQESVLGQSKPWFDFEIEHAQALRRTFFEIIIRRAGELRLTNEKLFFQDAEREKRAAELSIANEELIFQQREKQNRAAELIVVNKELVFQNHENEKRAAELLIANQELLYQNEEKEKRAAELIIANKELEQFAFIASHDLQEPLRTISNYMQVFEEDYLEQLDDDARKYLRSVNNATKRMSVLVHALLDFSRLGRDKKLADVDCKKLINDVIADLQSMINESNTAISVGNMPTLNLYEIEMGQLFQNLITNAIKFRKKNSNPEIQIRCRKVKDKWHFSVSDNGIGIAPAHFQRVFDIFQRLHTTDEYQGYGIGLANCKKIVTLHQGEMWIESTLGEGSTFHFTIPNL